MTANYLQNRLPTAPLDKTPYEYSLVDQNRKLVTFEFLADKLLHISQRRRKQNGLIRPSKECWLAMVCRQKAIKFRIPDGKIFMSRRVKFNKGQFNSYQSPLDPERYQVFTPSQIPIEALFDSTADNNCDTATESKYYLRKL